MKTIRVIFALVLAMIALLGANASDFYHKHHKHHKHTSKLKILHAKKGAQVTLECNNGYHKQKIVRRRKIAFKLPKFTPCILNISYNKCTQTTTLNLDHNRKINFLDLVDSCAVKPTPIPNKHKAISPFEYQKMLKVGMDVDWCKTYQGRLYSTKSHKAGINVPLLFKKRGLSHVRIRVKDNVLKDPKLLQEMKEMVNDSIKAGIVPIIAYQAHEFKDAPDNDVVLNNVVAWWQKVARTFKDYPYELSYDLIIETTGALKKRNDRLNLIYEKVTNAIRKIDKKRIILVAPNKISNPYELDKLVVPQPPDYLMVEWHFYAAGPKKHNPKKQWTTGTKTEKKLILDKINHAYSWSKQQNIPTWVGAWMANNYKQINSGNTLEDGAPAGGEYSVKEQKVFARFMSDSLRAKGIPYSVNSDTKFFNRKTNQWYHSMSEVLDIMLGR